MADFFKIKNDQPIRVRATTLIGGRRGRSRDIAPAMPALDIAPIAALLENRFNQNQEGGGDSVADTAAIQAAAAAAAAAQADADANATSIGTLQGNITTAQNAANAALAAANEADDTADAAQATATAAQTAATNAGTAAGTAQTAANTANTAATNAMTEAKSREVQLTVVDYVTNLAVGNGKAYFHISPKLAGKNLVYVHAKVITAGTTGLTTIQIQRTRGGTTVAMLSTPLTIDSAETGSDTANAAAVINTANDDVVVNDLIRIDITTISTTPPKGLIVTLGFAAP